ncbi:MAG: hypothetical protein AAF404_22340 [Pseudomonadota bacterium]
MINFVVALPAEAAPVIQHWRLKKSNHQHPFTLYHNENMRLVVSGMGKCNSAAATAWLAGITSDRRQRSSIWINLGIAGHQQFAVGTLICASRIIDAATKRSWYPTLIKNPLTKASVQTVDAPSSDYNSTHALEMEASGFYATALNLTTAELIQCFKVISDNPDNSLDRLDAETVRTLIKDSLTNIDNQLQTLMELSQHSETIDSASLESAFQAQWRFTTTQKVQLQRLMQRLVALSGSMLAAQQLLDNPPDTASNASSVLQALEAIVLGINDNQTATR